MRPALLIVLLSLIVSISTPASVDAAAPTIGGCQMFPDNNAWNTPIVDAPLHPRSQQIVANINANGGDNVHPDFGENPAYGIPWVTVAGNTQPFVPVTFDYADESDAGPYPVPPDAPVEGGGDRHVLVVDTDNCDLYELYAAEYQGGAENAWTAGSGAVFDLSSNALRPDRWTSADAAGLPILPGLARCDEALSGEITHALRFTVSRTRKAYVYPATHFASNLTGENYPSMGMRFRLKPNYNISDFPPQAKTIAQALKTYGMILADNGSNWYISGETNPACWDDDQLNVLKSIPGTAFEVVQSPPPPSDSLDNLLANGGFEGADEAKVPLGWKLRNKSGEKRLCNKVYAINDQWNKIKAFDGQCAFQFKGKANERSKLKQGIRDNLPNAGDRLQFQGQVFARNLGAAEAEVMVKVKYADGTPDKFKFGLSPGSYEYTPYDVTTDALSGTPDKIIVQIKMKGTSGKFRLDALSLTTVPGVALPPAPVD